MKFEKLNEDKIRITLNTQDLIDRKIDFHKFMSNSLNSQDLFLEILAEAEEKVGFVTKNYKVRIEALAMNDGDFIFTVTRLMQNKEKDVKKTGGLKVKRKNMNYTSNTNNILIYRFNSFEDFCNFANFINHSNIKNINSIANQVILYKYNNKFYLMLSNINPDHKYSKHFSNILTEFGTYKCNAEIFARKLTECGEIFIKNNALKTCIKYFS